MLSPSPLPWGLPPPLLLVLEAQCHNLVRSSGVVEVAPCCTSPLYAWSVQAETAETGQCTLARAGLILLPAVKSFASFLLAQRFGLVIQ